MKHLLLFLLLPAIGRAQRANPLVAVEHAFARETLDSGIRTAFIHYFDSNGVAFDSEGAHNGWAFYQSQPERRIRLLWEPAYTALSGSGDFGCTAGPYTVRDSSDTRTLGEGNYVTVWKKESDGTWKVLADIGTAYEGSHYRKPLMTRPVTGLTSTSGMNVRYLETTFIEAYRTKGLAAYDPYLLPGTHIDAYHSYPTPGIPARALLKKMPAGLHFQLIDGGGSATGDLAYAYGSATYEVYRCNYLRIWGHTAKGWKLLAQIMDQAVTIN